MKMLAAHRQKKIARQLKPIVPKIFTDPPPELNPAMIRLSSQLSEAPKRVIDV
jgi:hypothetical protein